MRVRKLQLCQACGRTFRPGRGASSEICAPCWERARAAVAERKAVAVEYQPVEVEWVAPVVDFEVPDVPYRVNE